MTARAGLVVVLALLGCATSPVRRHRHRLSPPARESRAGAPKRSAGPSPGVLASHAARGSSLSAARARGDVFRAIEAASALVGRNTIVLDGVDYGPGCAALVLAAFAHAGHPFPPEVHDAAGVHAFASYHCALAAPRAPTAGDLVFLADRPGGLPAHVGLVTRADPDGTALVLHRLARGVERVRINLAYPEQSADPATGRRINDLLIVKARAIPAGSLVVAISDLLRRRSTSCGSSLKQKPAKG